MKEEEHITRNEQETEKLGGEVIRQLLAEKGKSRVVLLYGQLGAGKTVFVKGVCKELNFYDVTSPSFVLVNIYPTKPVIYHIDLYRLEGKKDIEDTEIEELLLRSTHGLVFVEWAEKLRGIP